MNGRIFFWSITSALAGFLFGFDTVVISGAEQKIQALWGLSAGVHGIAMASALYGTVLGSLFGGWPTDVSGARQRCCLSACSTCVGASAAPLPTMSMFHRRACHRRHWHRHLHGGGAALHLGNCAAEASRAAGGDVSVQHRFRHPHRLCCPTRCWRASAKMPGAGCWGWPPFRRSSMP